LRRRAVARRSDRGAHGCRAARGAARRGLRVRARWWRGPL